MSFAIINVKMSYYHDYIENVECIKTFNKVSDAFFYVKDKELCYDNLYIVEIEDTPS